MPICALCGKGGMKTFEEYSHHVCQKPGEATIKPVRTTTRTKGQIVEALEQKIGLKHFVGFGSEPAPDITMSYEHFMKNLMKRGNV